MGLCRPIPERRQLYDRQLGHWKGLGKFSMSLLDRANRHSQNYIHWSQFGKTYTRPGVVTEGVNIWQINFDVDVAPTADNSVGTLTIQLAGATTTSGNTGAVQGAWPFLPISTSVNNQAPFVWTITPQESGSCGVRSGGWPNEYSTLLC